MIMMCSYSLYLILMYFNPTIEGYLYRITNTVKETQSPVHHLGYTGLAPARDDGTDEFCADRHQKPEESELGEQEVAQGGGEDEMNTAATLMINDDEVEIKTDVGTPDKGNGCLVLLLRT